ncbi:hypothetical protein KGV52_01260 [Candidatus Gracilibacteria bacterium]|nr:hypothetical protein [Candidatus Gracilibacteria bacterium]
MLLEHSKFIAEQGKTIGDIGLSQMVSQTSGLKMVTEKDKNGSNKKYILISPDFLGKCLLKEDRFEFEQGLGLSAIQEVRGRIEDTICKNMQSNPLEQLPFRVAFSTFPLVYHGTDEKIMNSIKNDTLSIETILENPQHFTVDLAINDNPDGMFGSFTLINAKIIPTLLDTVNTLQETKLHQIIQGSTNTTIHSKNEIGLIIQKPDGSRIKIDDYHATFDSQVVGTEMLKTTVRLPQDLQLSNVEDYKKERINVEVSLQALLDYYKEFFRGEIQLPGIITTKNTDIVINKLYTANGGKIESREDLLKILEKIPQKTQKHNLYKKLINSFKFKDGVINIEAKKLKTTPPLNLAMLELLNNEAGKGFNMFEPKMERDKISTGFEKLMEAIVGSGEQEIKVLKKIKNKERLVSLTPDYVSIEENTKDKQARIYDFKLSAKAKNKYEDFIGRDIQYGKQWETYKCLSSTNVFLEKDGEETENSISVETFLKERNYSLTDLQEQRLEKLRKEYKFLQDLEEQQIQIEEEQKDVKNQVLNILM